MSAGNRPRIRPMVAEDLDLVLRWRNHLQTRRYMFTQHEITQDEHLAWFTGESKNPLTRLCIFEDAGKPKGFVRFSNVAIGAIASWGFYADPDAVKGTGRRLGVTALNLAFERLDLHKICGQALYFNAASIRFHEALGFLREGLLRDQVRIGDTYHDLVCFGLLRREWTPENLE